MKFYPEHFKFKIAAAIAAGHSQKQVAKTLGVNQSTISRFVRRPDVKAMIEAEDARLTRELMEQVLQASQDPKIRAETQAIFQKEFMRSIGRTIKDACS